MDSRQRGWFTLRRLCSAACALAIAATGKAAEPMIDESGFAAFRTWAESHAAASDPQARSKIEAQGRELAAKRRDAMARLIPTNPNRALELALPDRLRRDLPASVASLLEQRLSGRGDFSVLVADDFEKGRAEFHRSVTLAGNTYRAFVFGRALEWTTAQNVPLQGIALDDRMAVDEHPARRLDPADVASSTLPVGNPDMRCPVCGQPASRDLAVEFAGKIVFLDRPEHISAIDKSTE